MTDLGGRALYFSRAPIPLVRDPEAGTAGFEALQHLGIYGYSGTFLRRLAGLTPGRLARLENLEQLQWLENQVPIDVVLTETIWGGIDTPAELVSFAARWRPPRSGEAE